MYHFTTKTSGCQTALFRFHSGRTAKFVWSDPGCELCVLFLDASTHERYLEQKSDLWYCYEMKLTGVPAPVLSRCASQYLAGASIGSGLSAQWRVGQTHVLDDLGELEVYLQQQVLTPPAHHTAKDMKMLQLSRFWQRHGFQSQSHQTREKECSFYYPEISSKRSRTDIWLTTRSGGGGVF